MYDVLEKKIERAILVGLGKEYDVLSESGSSNNLEELRLLADTAGAEVVGTVIQTRHDITPAYYIGKGKVSELKAEVERLDANMVIFDNDLSPAQLSNLEKLLTVKVIDRSGLILDIFAIRAKTREAKTQVELAQLKYLLPRLTRRWTHLSRQEGGIGMRGPGETQLEVDRRRIRQRISHLTDVIVKIEKRRETGTKRRQSCFKIALVGYTNAGKSTLLNALSGAGVPVENKLFKTLDSVTRLVRYDSAPEMLISDTVGFIRDLPHDLVASFKSTLDEVREADILLHVVDITNPEWKKQIDVVIGVLAGLGSIDTETIIVFNKIDRLKHSEVIDGLRTQFSNSVCVSGKYGDGIGELKEVLVNSVMKSRVRLTRKFGPEEGYFIGEIYRYGTVQEARMNEDSVELTFTIPLIIAEKLRLLERAEELNNS